MEYGVDFNHIRKLQLVSVGRNNFFDLIRASILPIKNFNRLVCVQIFCNVSDHQVVVTTMAGHTAERGPEKVERGRRYGSAKAERGHRWYAGKRSAVLNFYPYRTRISSHNLF